MKTLLSISLLIVLIAVPAFGQSTNSVSVHYPLFTLTAVSNDAADKGLAPFVVGKFDEVPAKNPTSRFGLLYREYASKSNDFTMMEIIDAASNKIIKKISLGEYYGVETSSWKNIPAENTSSESSATSVFLCTVKEGEFKLSREISIVTDQNLPLSTKLMMTLSLQPKVAIKLKVKFYGIAEGLVSSSGKSISIVDSEPLVKIHPAIIAFIPEAYQIKVEPQKKGKPSTFSVITNEASLNAGKKEVVFSMAISGTTVTFPGQIEKQLNNLSNYFNTNRPTPDMAVITQPNKLKALPGDTLMYTISYHNIGTDVATDISLVGPIPVGAEYVDGSTESNETTMTLIRKEAKAPSVGAVTSVNWNDKRTIKSGEERWVRYKVVIR